jgi:hypothetical protein
MLVVLKIPVVYLGVVVWWAIRAEPAPEGGTDESYALVPLSPCGWDEWRRGRTRRYSGRRPVRPVHPTRPCPRAFAGAPA